MKEGGILEGRTPRLVGSQPGRGLWALSRQGALCVSAVHFPDVPCCHDQHISAECLYFHAPMFSPGPAELLSSVSEGAVVLLPGSEVSSSGYVRCSWRSLAGTANSLLLICQSLISHFNVSRKPSLSSPRSTKDWLWGRIMLNFLFICIYDFFRFSFLAWLCTVPILCLPQGGCELLQSSCQLFPEYLW